MQLLPVQAGGSRTVDEEFRRYRFVSFSFDARANSLGLEIEDDWEPDVQALHRENKERIRLGLGREYGPDDFDRKEGDFLALGVAPVSVLAIHNSLLGQVRTAFVSGAYYPALTGAVSLGERLLNELIFKLRSHYLTHDATKSVRGGSVQDWSRAISVLGAWGVIDKETSRLYEKLRKLRNDAVHWNLRDLHETGGRAEALAAITAMQTIIGNLFPALGGSHYISIPGLSFIKRQSESVPLVREFFLPASALVSPEHTYVDFAQPTMQILDNRDWAIDHGVYALSDAEFASSGPGMVSYIPGHLTD